MPSTAKLLYIHSLTYQDNPVRFVFHFYFVDEESKRLRDEVENLKTHTLIGFTPELLE